MKAIRTIVTAAAIVTLDLDNYKSVACVYDVAAA